MTRIIFVEVDSDDQAEIHKRFPSALCLEGVPHDPAKDLKDAEIICCFINSRFDAALLKSLANLKLLVTRSVGYDHIDVATCAKSDVTVCNVPDYGSHVIAEHVFALILSTLRHIPEGDKRVESGVFDYHGLRGMALRGKTIGIVGTGKIGRRVAQIAHGFGMNILATDHCRTTELVDLLGVAYVNLDELLRQSDIITLHMPETPQTKHLIDSNAFGKMKRGAILVNTARGSLIDSQALLSALNEGKLAYALLDVLEHEQNFLENAELIRHPRVVTTPHIAFYADDSMRNMYEDAFTSIDQWLAGERPEHAISPLTIVCDLPGVRKV